MASSRFIGGRAIGFVVGDQHLVRVTTTVDLTRRSAGAQAPAIVYLSAAAGHEQRRESHLHSSPGTWRAISCASASSKSSWRTRTPGGFHPPSGGTSAADCSSRCTALPRATRVAAGHRAGRSTGTSSGEARSREVGGCTHRLFSHALPEPSGRRFLGGAVGLLNSRRVQSSSVLPAEYEAPKPSPTSARFLDQLTALRTFLHRAQTSSRSAWPFAGAPQTTYRIGCGVIATYRSPPIVVFPPLRDGRDWPLHGPSLLRTCFGIRRIPSGVSRRCAGRRHAMQPRLNHRRTGRQRGWCRQNAIGRSAIGATRSITLTLVAFEFSRSRFTRADGRPPPGYEACSVAFSRFRRVSAR